MRLVSYRLNPGTAVGDCITDFRACSYSVIGFGYNEVNRLWYLAKRPHNSFSALVCSVVSWFAKQRELGRGTDTQD